MYRSPLQPCAISDKCSRIHRKSKRHCGSYTIQYSRNPIEARWPDLGYANNALNNASNNAENAQNNAIVDFVPLTISQKFADLLLLLVLAKIKPLLDCLRLLWNFELIMVRSCSRVLDPLSLFHIPIVSVRSVISLSPLTR